MKAPTLIPSLKSILLALVLAGPVRGDTFNLRYEWAPSAGGPFTPVPESMIQINPDGSATVAKTGPAAFFRVRINDSADGGAGGGGTSAPVQTFDSLPPLVRDNVRLLLEGIAADGTDEGNQWKGARVSPFVTPITSMWNETGVPDMVEIKIIGPCDTPRTEGIFRHNDGGRGSVDRGFILAGVSRKVPPIVGYKTDGRTQTEELMRHCVAGNVSCIRRFGPMFIAAEDTSKNLLGNLGLLPTLLPESAYHEQSVPVSLTWDSESPTNPPLPGKPTPAAPREFSSFAGLLKACQDSPFLTARREQREALIEFDWLSLEGAAPTLKIKTGERATFLTDQTFVRYRLDDEDVARPAEISLGRTGLDITGGTVPGAYTLTLEDNRGQLSRYNLRVTAPGAQARDAQNGVCITTQMWEAGTKDTQPRYDQRSDLDRWCESVGCGPVMLALLIASTEKFQDVPSAYWSRVPSHTLTQRRASMRTVDAPQLYVGGDSPVTNTNMRYWYDWLHDQCNVACWPHNGSGSTLPGDAGDALFTHFANATSILQPSFLQDPVPLPRYVSGGAHWEADGFSDDWDESGIRTANAIKAGRVGGIYYMEHWHYAVAYRYRKTVYKFMLDGQVIQSATQRQFRVNTGWGDADAVWNAYDIDGCYLLNLTQNRLPPQ